MVSALDTLGTDTLDLSHLYSAAGAAAVLPIEQRLHHVRADRWIGYPRASDAVHRLHQPRHWPRKQRMPNLLIVGPTNNGKSMIIEKFRRDAMAAPKAQNRDEDQTSMPVVVMQMPAEPSPARFYATLLDASRSTARPETRSRPVVADMERTATWWLSGSDLQILVIDELHNILAGNAARRREFLNLLRYLGNRLGIPIAGIRTESEPTTRTWRSALMISWRTASSLWYCHAGNPTTKSSPCWPASPRRSRRRRRSPIATAAMATYLIERSEGAIGELAALLTAAATVAVTSGEEAITADTLEAADYRGPSERRRSFERALH